MGYERDELDRVMLARALNRESVFVRQADGAVQRVTLLSWGMRGTERQRARVRSSKGRAFTVRKSQVILPEESS